jgi:hypothetical protein
MAVPTQVAPGPRAPKRLRLKSASMATTLPPGAQLLVDSMVGTLFGSTRAEVLRFMAISWISEHYAAVKQLVDASKEQRK